MTPALWKRKGFLKPTGYPSDSPKRDLCRSINLRPKARCEDREYFKVTKMVSFNPAVVSRKLTHQLASESQFTTIRQLFRRPYPPNCVSVSSLARRQKSIHSMAGFHLFRYKRQQRNNIS